MNKSLQDAMNKAINAEPIEEDSTEESTGILIEDYEIGSPIVPPTGQGVPHDSLEDTPFDYDATRPTETVDEIDPDTQPPTKMMLSVKGLDEKAVLISVKRNMYSPYKLDQEESKNYGAGNVNKH